MSSPQNPQNFDSGGRESNSFHGNEAVGIVENNNSNNKGIDSQVSECSVDLEIRAQKAEESETNLGKSDRNRDWNCRICHLSTDSTSSNQESGIPIQLGCCCKEDLGAAHRECAEAWFKIRGNKTCEICGSIAQNVVGVATEEHHNEVNNISTAPTGVHLSESRNFWQGHRFLNFLLACMVFAFVISWLFHFNVPS